MIRPELHPPTRHPDYVASLVYMAGQIIAAIEARQPHDHLLSAFNSVAYEPVTTTEFLGGLGSMPLREFAESLLIPKPRFIDGMTREDFLEIIRCILDENNEGLLPRCELDFWVGLLEVNIPSPYVSELLFGRGKLKLPEQVLAEAMRYESDLGMRLSLTQEWILRWLASHDSSGRTALGKDLFGRTTYNEQDFDVLVNAGLIAIKYTNQNWKSLGTVSGSAVLRITTKGKAFLDSRYPV